jgi:hypothetical protein
MGQCLTRDATGSGAEEQFGGALRGAISRVPWTPDSEAPAPFCPSTCGDPDLRSGAAPSTIPHFQEIFRNTGGLGLAALASARNIRRGRGPHEDM